MRLNAVASGTIESLMQCCEGLDTAWTRFLETVDVKTTDEGLKKLTADYAQFQEDSTKDFTQWQGKNACPPEFKATLQTVLVAQRNFESRDLTNKIKELSEK